MTCSQGTSSRSSLGSLCAEGASLALVLARPQVPGLGLGLDKIVAMAERASTHKGDRFAEPEADPVEVEAGWRDAAAIHETQALKEALRAAEQALEADPSEEALERITEIQARLARAAEALTLPTH
jgi:hypothetical protein